MLQEVDRAFGCGADGVAIGGLTADFRLDRDLLFGLPDRYPSKEIVIHRAFDFVVEPQGGSQQLVEWGFARILTRAGPNDGRRRMCCVGRADAGRFGANRDPAGSGIQPENAREILQRLAVVNCTDLYVILAILWAKRRS